MTVEGHRRVAGEALQLGAVRAFAVHVEPEGNPALVADVVVAFGALRAAVAGARTNVSFDLGSLRSAGTSLEDVREQHPDLWANVERLTAALDRIDGLAARIDDRAAPTDSI